MSGDVSQILDYVRLGVAGVFVIFGLVLIIGGVVGLLRFPDFYTRLHAVRASDGVGAVIVLIGLAIASWDLAMTLRLGLLGALIVAASPTIAHLAANAAHAGGLAPLAGAYTAPRPGVRSAREGG